MQGLGLSLTARGGILRGLAERAENHTVCTKLSTKLSTNALAAGGGQTRLTRGFRTSSLC